VEVYLRTAEYLAATLKSCWGGHSVNFNYIRRSLCSHLSDSRVRSTALLIPAWVLSTCFHASPAIYHQSRERSLDPTSTTKSTRRDHRFTHILARQHIVAFASASQSIPSISGVGSSIAARTLTTRPRPSFAPASRLARVKTLQSLMHPRLAIV
jgi:hypothetical protein